MSFHSWLQNLRSALAPGRGHRRRPRRSGAPQPRLEVLEDRMVPSGFQQINLVGYQPGLAHFTDPNLNGWGMTSMPDGSFAVANAFTTGLATFYDRSGHVLPQTITVPSSSVPTLFGTPGSPGHPTGVVYNSTSDFKITNPDTGVSAPATLIFDSIDGTISGWNPEVDPTHAIVMRDTWAEAQAKVVTSAGYAVKAAVYTGLEIGQDRQGHPVLYAADFLNNQLEVIDGCFNDIGKPISTAGRGVSSDPYSWIWSVQAVGHNLYVTFADLFGPTAGGGAVDVFNADGSYYQLDANGPGAGGRLQNPWGITQAPAKFGAYSNDLLVGNVLGNVAGAGGHINVYDPNSLQYLGQLDQPDGTPIAIKGLWDLEFGDGTPDSGKTNQLYFDAGPNHPGDASDGLFGVIHAAGDQGGNGSGTRLTNSLQVAPSQPADIMSASIKSSSHGHGGGSGGGSSGSFYPTTSNVSQLIADINYANLVGGTVTINLQPNTTFDLNQINNTSYSYYNANALPIVGGTKAVDLTILGNGDTIAWAGGSTYSNVEVRLLDVAQSASLTLDDVKLQNGSAIEGGAIYNQGTLNVIDQSTLSGNVASDGGGIYNLGGTVVISDSILSGNSAFLGGAIYNDGGTLTINNSTLSGNHAEQIPVGYGGGPSGEGGGVYNAGTVTVENSSSITGNSGDDVYNLRVLFLDSTSTVGTLDGNPATPI